MSDSSPVRFGILGCANIARKASRAIALAPNAVISAVGSRSFEKATAFAKENGYPSTTKIYGSYEAVLDDPEVDAVYVPLPTSLHVKWAALAAQKKKHVLLEKPVALNVKELDVILEECESNGVQFMDATMWMHHPRTAKMKEFLSDSQRFGHLKSVHSTVAYFGDTEFLKNNIRVKADLDALGALGDVGWYCIRAQQEMRGMFAQLCRDDTPMVRKAAASALGQFAASMDPASASTDMMPLFLVLAQDRQDSVRIHAVDNAVALAKLVPHDILSTQVLPTVFETARDGSWRVRWSVANRFPEICEVTSADIVNSTVCDCLVALLQDTEAEVRTAATSKVIGLCRVMQPQRIIEKIVPCFQMLARDLSDHVRSALASVVMKVAPFLGRDLTIDHLLPLFLLLLNDQNSEVRLNVISNLEEGNSVIGIELLSQSLLPAIVHLAEDRQWRVRLAIIEYIPQLATQLGREYFEERLSGLCMSWLADNVYSIRAEAATVNLRRLCEAFGVEWARGHIVPRIVEMHQDANYLQRLTSLYAVKTLSEVVNPETLQEVLIPLTTSLAQDPVPNIRFNVAKTLESVVARAGGSAVESHIRPCLQALIQDSDGDVVYFATRALSKC